MKLKIHKHLPLLLTMFLVSICASAQEGTAIKILQAKAKYEEGKIDEIPALLDFDEHLLSKTEKQEVYKLLVVTHLYSHELVKAQDMMIKFLEVNPEYEINRELDPSEFIELYNRCRTDPVVLVGFKVGSNVQQVSVINNYAIDNSNESQGTYSSNNGLLLTLYSEFPIKRHVGVNDTVRGSFAIVPELTFSSKSYIYKDLFLDHINTTITETQSHFELPILARYNHNLGRKKNRYYFDFGPNLSYMLSSSADALLQLDQSDGSQKEDEENGIDLLEKRNALNFGLSAGAGLKLKGAATGKGYFTLEVRYNLGLTDIINGDNRNTEDIAINSTLRNTYGYIDDAYSLNQVTFSLGYLVPIYKPKILEVKYKEQKPKKKKKEDPQTEETE